MRYLLVALSILLWPLTPAQAQIGINIELPGINIGINVPTYPQLVLIPGYPVYYDPRANSNYFFYDGLYWVYQSDDWYASSWYNGPWELVRPEDVPLYVLRVPVRYYRHPPSYFHGWRADAPPRWGEHWGNDWEKRRAGWDQWNHRSVQPAAPLPTYQRQYSGNRYPRAPEQQVTIRAQNYKYQPREAVTRQHFQQHVQPQAAPGGPRTETHPQATVQQRSPAPQQRSQPSQPPQHPQSVQPRREQPVQQAQPQAPVQRAQPQAPVQRAQPKQPPAQAQRAEPKPPAKVQENKTDANRKGPENKADANRKGPENKANANRKGPENKADPQRKGQENNKKEERDPGSG